MQIFLFFLVLLQCVLSVTILIVGVVLAYFMINSKFMLNSPPVPTQGKVRQGMVEDVARLLARRKNQVVMDLGSGWGSLLLPLAKRFPEHHFIGIEYGFLPCFVSRLRARGLHNITFRRENFFKTDISQANVIFMFLLKHIMVKITPKCQKECKKGTLIYANRFPMPDVKPEQEVSFGSKYLTYYVYKIS